ncbi:MAG TPA: hypothetical protein VHM02_08935, partial [Thermoanaerobaculia bacterium]|nr:hypothetical protein [Thermoanaerobaculia bacterium]
MTPASSSAPSPSARELIARVHRERRSGVVEVAVEEGVRRLVLRDGELFLPADHPLAGAVAPFLPLWPPRARAAGGAREVRGLMARIAFLVGSWEGETRWIAEEEGGEMVGPLPTRLLLMEWAAGRSADELAAALGGDEAELAAREPEDRSAALAARLLDPHAAVLLSRLSRPTRLADVVRQTGGARGRVLADLARLEAAGLIRRRAEAV